MASVNLENVSKFYGPVQAVKDYSLFCADGEMVALLGPSGCGKTSTLMMIAGIEEVSAGEIYFDGRPVSHLSPGERNIAMVFEDYALYPDMSVFENVAFPLKIRKYLGSEIRAKVEPALELLGLKDMRDRNVRRLSGGAQQRVSIGRALVREPELIIFDEPLSHLDGDQKVQLRTEIKRLQKSSGLTAILVTHDQTEAIAMADQVVVMNLGVLQQAAAPQTLYENPANIFVASFIGEPPMNLLPARLDAGDGLPKLSGPGWSFTLAPETGTRIAKVGQDEELILGLRPEDFRVSPLNGKSATSGTVTWREHRGDADILTVELDGEETEIVIESRNLRGLGLGTRLNIEFPETGLNVFAAGDGRNLLAHNDGA